MDLKNLRKKTKDELQKLLKEKEDELRKVVTEIFKTKEKNIKKPSFLRKDIARIKTIINQKMSKKDTSLKEEDKDE